MEALDPAEAARHAAAVEAFRARLKEEVKDSADKFDDMVQRRDGRRRWKFEGGVPGCGAPPGLAAGSGSSARALPAP